MKMFRKASSMSLIAIVVLIVVLLWCQSAFAFEWPTLVNVTVSESANLTGPVYASDIVAAGAYVMVIFTNNSGAFSQFSFSYGSSFPSWTSRRLTSNSSVMNLVSDGRDVLAVGLLNNKLQSLEFSFSDFSWSSSSVIFDDPVAHVSCGAKLGLIVCAVASDPAVAEGMQIFSYNTSQLNRTNLVWQKRTGSGLPVTKSRPGVASDGSSFMVCSIGDSGGAIELICSKSTNGIDDYSNTALQPTNATATFNPSDRVVVTSNGVPGVYMVAFAQGGTIRTRITHDTGETWDDGPSLNLASLPSFLTFASTFTAIFQKTGFAEITFRNISNPAEFETPVKLMDGNKVSFASGRFNTNYHAASNLAGGILVRSCIPTAAPTLAPSPSPTKVGGTATTPSAARSVALVVTLLAMLASFY